MNEAKPSPVELLRPADAEPDIFTAGAIGSDFLQEKRRGRPWLYRKLFLRGKVTAIGGAGGVGKSIFILTALVSMAIGRDLLKEGQPEIRRRRVLVINNEDEEAELELRLEAILRYHGISPDELGDRFFYRSGYHQQIRLAKRELESFGEGRTFAATDMMRSIETYVQLWDIDLVAVDPLVSLHDAEENSNGEMDQVMSVIKAMAARRQIGFCLLHHTNKAADTANIDNSMRGASAVVNAARVVTVFTRMTEAERAKTIVEPKDRTRYICAHHGKANMSLPVALGEWYRLESAPLSVIDEDGNDDTEWVGVPVPVDMEALVKEEEAPRKMEPTDVAEMLEPIMNGRDRVLLPDLLASVQRAQDASETTARRLIERLPEGKDLAIKIRSGGHLVCYWREKSAGKEERRREPGERAKTIVVYREELS